MLTPQQTKFIDIYCKSKNITETANEMGISRTKCYNYLNDKEVKNELEKINNETIRDTTNYLRDNLLECSKTLMDIIKDPNTSNQIRINAINSVFANTIKLNDQLNVIDKINELEGRITIINDLPRED